MPLARADSLLPLSPVKASVLRSDQKRNIFTLEVAQASMAYGAGVPRWICVLVWAVVFTGAVGATDGPRGRVAKQERQDCLGLFPTPYCDLHYPDPSTAASSIPLTALGIPVKQCRQQSEEEAREVRACRGLRAAVQGASVAVVHSPGLGPLRGREGANAVVGTLNTPLHVRTTHVTLLTTLTTQGWSGTVQVGAEAWSALQELAHPGNGGEAGHGDLDPAPALLRRLAGNCSLAPDPDSIYRARRLVVGGGGGGAGEEWGALACRFQAQRRAEAEGEEDSFSLVRTRFVGQPLVIPSICALADTTLLRESAPLHPHRVPPPLLLAVCCLLSVESCLLSVVCCLLSAVYCLWPSIAVFVLLCASGLGPRSCFNFK
jgi:hypothetical protein